MYNRCWNSLLSSIVRIIGVELCGSIKNVIAIASGILEGLGYTESTRSFLITESLHDIKSLIYGLGGKKKTILSYAGVGDLLLTATSSKSRNYTYGILIGKKNYTMAEDYLKNNTVEGYNDSVYLIKKVIENAQTEVNLEKRNRIINLYRVSFIVLF